MRAHLHQSSLSVAIAVALGVALVPHARAAEVPRAGEPVDIERIIKSMTLEEKVGQLMMIGFGGTRANNQMAFWVAERHVGGVALFSRNIVDFEQTARFTRELHGLAQKKLPIFVALDQEGGNVVRVKDGAMVLPGNMALGATRSPSLAYVAGQGLAVDLRRLGFNMNLAPVLDVNSNPSNPVIGIRSYGERPELVAELGAWYVRGQQELGVVAVAKHFPGHGDTLADSHFSMPSIDADMRRLEQVELAPFRRAMAAGLDAVMTAHIALPRIAETRDTPATLSHILLTDVLRKRLGFDGLVMTDGLEMQGIVQRYGAGRAAVLAILAGADMTMVLWLAELKEEVYQSLLAAVKNGEISQERLNQSLRRILRVKAKRGIFDRELEPLEVVLRQRDNPLHGQVAARIARESVTLVRNHGGILPLHDVRYRKIVVMAPPGPFATLLGQRRNVQVYEVPSVPSRERRADDVNKIANLAADADLFLVAAVNRTHVEMARAVLRLLPQMPVALVSFASPYYLSSLPEIDAYVCTYGYLDVSQLAAARAVLGQAPMFGRLPVSIPGFYAYGHRVGDERVATLPLSGGAVR